MRGKQGHTIHFSGGKVFSVDELYDRFYDELVLWADTILNDMGEAEDLVQDFFVRLWEKKLNENLEGNGYGRTCMFPCGIWLSER